MKLNPYEAPQIVEEPTPLVPTKRPFWLDTIYLLATGVLVCFFGPYVIAVFAMMVSWLLRPFSG